MCSRFCTPAWTWCCICKIGLADYRIAHPLCGFPLLLLSTLDAGRSTPEHTGVPLACQGGGVFRKHLQARLRVSFENDSSIRVANQLWVFGR